MPDVAPIESIDMKGWTKGLNREADAFLLEVDEVADALNVDFGLRGEVSKRKGFTKWSTDSVVYSHFWSWYELGGSYWMIMVDPYDGSIWYTDDTSPTDSTINIGAEGSARDYPLSFVSMNNNVYLTTLRGSINPQKWNGTSLVAVTATLFDGTANRFPRCRHMVHLHERFFAFNVQVGTTATHHRSRMYYSEPATPETWNALDYIDFSPDDGSEITGAVAFGEAIVVFKNRSLFLLTGVDANTFTVYPVDTALGSESPGTMICDGPYLYFYDHRTGVWQFDGTNFKRLSDKIQTYILDGQNESAAHRASAFAYRGRYYLSLPWGTDTYPSRTFVYDSRIDAWTEYDYGFTAADVVDNSPYIVGPLSSASVYSQLGGIFNFETGYGDNANAVNAYFRTAWLAPTNASAQHRIRRVDLSLDTRGDFDVTMRMWKDFSTDAYRTQVLNTDPGGMIWDTSLWGADWGSPKDEILVRLTGWGGLWRAVRFGFEETTATGDFQINRMTFHLSSRRRVRGEH